MSTSSASLSKSDDWMSVEYIADNAALARSSSSTASSSATSLATNLRRLRKLRHGPYRNHHQSQGNQVREGCVSVCPTWRASSNPLRQSSRRQTRRSHRTRPCSRLFIPEHVMHLSMVYCCSSYAGGVALVCRLHGVISVLMLMLSIRTSMTLICTFTI
ncbi:hypothetical protein BKA62DRAFT_418674 [Auriculariales sp. MPI-PUGE-AT-0066]|nr:hypothetical protein BKA62DRAFT_418674 [Auriculariales sp. MPI-PUGE-AT-0066]